MSEKEIKEVIIPAKLAEIEKKENVRIIYCVESGSRAWGFASPDSDFDVRFIYVRPKEYYLRLDKTRDVIEWQLDDTLDINGWDLQKALTLLHKSNPTMFEWNNSPIVYKTTPEWETISNIINNYFQQKAILYHYLSIAKSNYKQYLTGETVRLKKYFYALRPILACKWIFDKKSPPPMSFLELADAYLNKEIAPIVNELLRLKKDISELGESNRIDIINSYIESSIAEIEAMLKNLPVKDSKNWDELNTIFLNILN
ncbi:MAG: nucleotidyltransferase domain-containing protein [Clostridia bacterium]|nr:nucleotidyltransferase domain-containing protein [Clostridia bacterium]